MPSASDLRRIACLFAVLELASCIGEGPPLSARRQTDDDAGGAPPINVDPRGSDAAVELGTIDPHALIGVDPSRGPFSGGQARTLRGNGFAPGLRVWFGPNEVPKGDIIPIDPSRAQVVVPAGAPGPVDVKTQIGGDASTARVLAGGYTYEDFYADPSTGPTSGGTIVHLYGQGTAWTAGTTVTIDNAPCEPVDVLKPTELTCTTPKGTAGAKSITVTAPDKVSVVREGFAYADSNNGFRGGLAGNKLTTSLTVLVLDDYTGAPIPGAYVLAGDDVATGVSKLTGGSGVVVFNDPMLGPKRSVTIAAKCYQPTTFVDVPVDSVTAYLTPVLSPACAAEGDPPSVGGRGIALSSLFGELVWGVDGEFRSAAWGNVPASIGPSEKLAAYVFTLVGRPSSAVLPARRIARRETRFADGQGRLPVLDAIRRSATSRSTPSPASRIATRALRSSRRTRWAVVRGVSATPGMTTSNIFIPMNIPLDHAVPLVAKTPDPGPRGPDRANFTVALELEKGGYAILPASSESWVMPVDRTLSFVGLPALSGAALGSALHRERARGHRVRSSRRRSPKSAYSRARAKRLRSTLSCRYPRSPIRPTAAPGTGSGSRIRSHPPVAPSIFYRDRHHERRRARRLARRGAGRRAQPVASRSANGVPARGACPRKRVDPHRGREHRRLRLRPAALPAARSCADSMPTRSTCSPPVLQ